MRYLSLIQQILLLGFVISVFSGGVFANTQDASKQVIQGLGTPKYHSIKSVKSETTYNLIVRLPDDYETNKKYPTVYLLDGGISYPLLSAYYHYLRFTNEIPQMIIVGISYGTDDWKKGNARSVDYTAKSPEREHWGGAENFQTLMKESILPLIEKNYPAAPNKRIIFGNSLAGQFVLYTAMTQPDLFAGHIASNPALHRNLPFFLNQENINSVKASQTRLFISSGQNDEARFRIPAVKWMQHWEKNNQHPWVLKTETLNNEGHMSAIPSSFFRGVKWVLNSQ